MSEASTSATERVEAAYERIAEVDRPEVWITLRRFEHARADAAAIDERVAAGEQLPLAGVTVSLRSFIFIPSVQLVVFGTTGRGSNNHGWDSR